MPMTAYPENAVGRLTDLVMSDRATTPDDEVRLLFLEAAVHLKDDRITELFERFWTSFQLIELAMIVNTPEQADGYRRECLAILREVSGLAH